MIEINKDKHIGDVIFIVEGEKTEINLLKHIFTKIFNYKFISKVRNGKVTENISYFQGVDKSCIVVVNTKTSAINSVLKTDENGNIELDDFSEQLIYELTLNYNIQINKSAVFYLFDRDPKLNTNISEITNIMELLKNPYENENNLEGGLFLISYPAFESFITSNFENECCNTNFYLGKDLKNYNTSNKYMHNKITEDTLKKATENFLSYLNIENISFDNDLDLDDFSKVNVEILNKQEKYCITNKGYRLVSLFIIVFLNLGLIKIEE